MAVVVASSMFKRITFFLSLLAAVFAILLSTRDAEAAIAIDPSYTNAAPGSVITFHASGGSGEYHWSMPTNPSGGFVESGGIYHAGLFPLVDDQVRVTDDNGDSATATVGVTYWETLVVRQPTGTIPPRGSRPLQVSGGLPPYSFSYVSNASGGSISSAGLYMAGRRGKVVDVVRITDTVGQVATAVFSVGAGLTITPGSAKVAPRADVDFNASGGDGLPAVWSIPQNRSGGSIDATTGAYTAGPSTHVADVVRAQDSLGNIAEVSVSVGGGVAIEPSIAWTSPRGTITFTGFGGTNSFAWSLAASPSGGTIDAVTGVYVAGKIGGVQDEVYAVDGAGNSASTVIDVGPAIALSPSSSAIEPLGTVLLSVSGGSGSYANATIEVNETGGSVGTDLVYTAGPKEGRDTIIITDSVGSAARATVDVKTLPATESETTASPSVGQMKGTNLGGGGTTGCHAAPLANAGASTGFLLAICAAFALRRRRHSQRGSEISE